MTKLLYIGPRENAEVLKHALEDNGRVVDVVHAESGAAAMRLIEKGGIALVLCIWRDNGAGAGKAFVAAMLRHHVEVPTVAVINSKVLWDLQAANHPGMAELPIELIKDSKLDFVGILKKQVVPALLEKLSKESHRREIPARDGLYGQPNAGSPYKNWIPG